MVPGVQRDVDDGVPVSGVHLLSLPARGRAVITQSAGVVL